MYLNSAFPVFTAINKGRAGGRDNQGNCPLWSRLRKQRQQRLRVLGVPAATLIQSGNKQRCQAGTRSRDHGSFPPGLAVWLLWASRSPGQGPHAWEFSRGVGGAEAACRLRPIGHLRGLVASLRGSEQLPGCDTGAWWGKRQVCILPSPGLFPAYQS